MLLFKKISNRLNYYLKMNYKVSLSKFIFYKFALLLDRIRGVDFYQPLTLRDIGLAEVSDSIHYGATRSFEINKVLKMANASASDRILDFGSGKGLSLTDFEKYGFDKVVGVELSKDLVMIAKKNFKKLGITNIEILNCDATTIKNELDVFNYFYLYNPFTGRTFSLVIQNILESIERHPREVTIIYNYPLEKSIIESTQLFNLIGSYSSFFFGGEFLIYRNKN